MMLMVRVPLAMFQPAMFSDRLALSFWSVSVLTKVVVYTGIGIIATNLVPAMFEALEWGV